MTQYTTPEPTTLPPIEIKRKKEVEAYADKHADKEVARVHSKVVSLENRVRSLERLVEGLRADMRNKISRRT